MSKGGDNMIKLHKVKPEFVRRMLNLNGTRTSLIENTLAALDKERSRIEYGVDDDDKFTLVKIGARYGISKRCTYRKIGDSVRECTGFTLALLRALELSR